MKKIYLLLTFLTTAVIGLVFTSPTYAWVNSPNDLSIEPYMSNGQVTTFMSGSGTLIMNNMYYTNKYVSIVRFDIDLSIFNYEQYTFYMSDDEQDTISVLTWQFGHLEYDSDTYYYIYNQDLDNASLVPQMVSTSYLTSAFTLDISDLEETISFIVFHSDAESSSEIRDFTKSFASQIMFTRDSIQDLIIRYTNDSYAVGYQYGYSNGRSEGESIGRSAGYQDGHSNGLIEGYNEGYNEAKEAYGYWDDSLSIYVSADYAYSEGYELGLNTDFDYFAWMRTALWLPAQILAIEIWPGFQLGYFAFFTLFMGLIGFVFKLFGKGGK